MAQKKHKKKVANPHFDNKKKKMRKPAQNVWDETTFNALKSLKQSLENDEKKNPQPKVEKDETSKDDNNHQPKKKHTEGKKKRPRTNVSKIDTDHGVTIK